MTHEVVNFMVQSISSPAMDQLCGRFACKDYQDFEVAPSILVVLEPMLMALGHKVLSFDMVNKWRREVSLVVVVSGEIILLEFLCQIN